MKINNYCTLLNEERTEYLVSKGYVNCPQKNPLCSPNIISDFLNDSFLADHLPEEHLWLVCLNTKCRVNGVFEVSIGTVNAALSSVSEIFKRALMVGAVNIILAHNHPSGDDTPSEKDLILTKQVAEAGKLLDLPLLDHIIIGKGVYYSFHEKGII